MKQPIPEYRTVARFPNVLGQNQARMSGKPLTDQGSNDHIERT